MALYTRWLAALAIFAVLGCVLPQDIQRLDREDAAFRNELRDLRTDLRDTTKENQREIAELKKGAGVRQRELRKDVEHLQSELNRLETRLDEALYKYGKGTTGNKANIEEIKAVSAAIKRLSDRIDIVATHVGLRELVESPSPGVAHGRRRETARPVKETVPGERDYLRALEHYKNRRFIKALAGFQDYLKRHPATKLSDNALLWMGECYYNLKDYRQAILAYEKLLRDFPKSNKVPGALLKEGMAFSELGEKTSAAILLKMILKNHPNSEQARIAKRLLKNLRKR